MNSLKQLKGVSERKTPKKISKGVAFKERHGISLTMYKNIKKAGLLVGPQSLTTEVVSAYKELRKIRKKSEKRDWQLKREKSADYMLAKGSKTRKTKHKGRTKRGSAAKPYKAPKL